jgi:hypothetical protein
MAEPVLVPKLRRRPAAAEAVADLAPSFAAVPVAPAPPAAAPSEPVPAAASSIPLPAAPSPAAPVAPAATPPAAKAPAAAALVATARPAARRPATGRFAKTVAAAEELRGSADGEDEPWTHVVPQPAGRAEDDEGAKRWFWPRRKPAGD